MSGLLPDPGPASTLRRSETGDNPVINPEWTPRQPPVEVVLLGALQTVGVVPPLPEVQLV